MINKILIFDDADRSCDDDLAVFSSDFVQKLENKLRDKASEIVSENVCVYIFCQDSCRNLLKISKEEEKKDDWTISYLSVVNKNDEVLILCDYDWTSYEPNNDFIDKIWESFCKEELREQCHFVVTTRMTPERAERWLQDKKMNYNLISRLLELDWDEKIMICQIGEFIKNELQ